MYGTVLLAWAVEVVVVLVSALRLVPHIDWPWWQPLIQLPFPLASLAICAFVIPVILRASLRLGPRYKRGWYFEMRRDVYIQSSAFPRRSQTDSIAHLVGVQVRPSRASSSTHVRKTPLHSCKPLRVHASSEARKPHRSTDVQNLEDIFNFSEKFSLEMNQALALLLAHLQIRKEMLKSRQLQQLLV